jgi:uncharacterized protein (DUF305 family)
MHGMYRDVRANVAISATGAAMAVFFFISIREQLGIGDRQLMTAMIPHHASALLMCERADLQDPDLREMCSNMVSGQQQELEQMKAKLRALRP